MNRMLQELACTTSHKRARSTECEEEAAARGKAGDRATACARRRHLPVVELNELPLQKPWVLQRQAGRGDDACVCLCIAHYSTIASFSSVHRSVDVYRETLLCLLVCNANQADTGSEF